MRIVELNFEKTWRGGERQTLCNMMGFRNRGLHVELVCRKGAPLQKAAQKEGFIVHAFADIFELNNWLIRAAKKFDIMHAQTAQVLTYCAVTKPIHRCKLVYTRRVNFIPKGAMTRWKYLQTDALVGISQSVKNILVDFTGRKNVQMISSALVPTAPNKERGVSLLKQLNIENKKIIATTAALTEEKGPFVALEAIGLLSSQRNDFVFLHFGDGVLKQQMQEKIKAKGLENTYLLQGHVDNVEDFFSIMNIFLMSSYNEGLGSSVLDAFYHKVPVVSSNAGGLADLVSGGRAITCEPGDAQKMAEGMKRLLDNDALANKQADLAYDYVMKNHGLDAITDQYISLFEKLLKQ